jgi:hypothetical protein|eukprot:evm.model.NODE_44083_length_9951_cov_18.320570.1
MNAGSMPSVNIGLALKDPTIKAIAHEACVTKATTPANATNDPTLAINPVIQYNSVTNTKGPYRKGSSYTTFAHKYGPAAFAPAKCSRNKMGQSIGALKMTVNGHMYSRATTRAYSIPIKFRQFDRAC